MSDERTAESQESWLVRVGLADRCPHCGKARALAEQLTKQVQCCSKLALVAEKTTGQGTGTMVSPGGLNGSRVNVSCAVCQDTGLIPTARGWRFLAWEMAFCNSIPEHHKGTAMAIPDGDSIPF